VPQTTIGKIFGAFCAFCGVLIVSVPIGIISSNFSQVINKEKKEKYFFKVSRMMKIKENAAIFNSRFFDEFSKIRYKKRSVHELEV
jgi:hypothetical protein